MAITQSSDANSKQKDMRSQNSTARSIIVELHVLKHPEWMSFAIAVEEAIEPSRIESTEGASPSELTQLKKMGGDLNRCSDKGTSTGNQGTNRGMVKTYKLSKKRKKDNQDSLSDIDDSEVVRYINTKELINYKRILWEAMNRSYTEAKKYKRTMETKKCVLVKKAAKTTERVEFQVVGADSSYAHKNDDSPYGNISRHVSDDDVYKEDDINYGEDNGKFDYGDGGYEYEDEHCNDESFGF